MGQRNDHTLPEPATKALSLQALATRALERQAQPPSSERAEASQEPLSLVSVLTVRSHRDGTPGRHHPAPGYPPDFDPEAWATACLAEGEEPEVIAEFAELIDIIATEPAPERRQLWRLGDWPAYFDERAAIREYDGGMARAEAEHLAFIDCVKLYLDRHPPIAHGLGCVACAEPISVLPATYIACDDKRSGRIHTACADRFRLARIERAVMSLERLGVRDPKAAI